ncbi:MAG: nucleotidyltransferase family protein [Flavobacteriaceae bacterium]
MSYRETLLFIAKCLTISLEDKNYTIIKSELEKRAIDWDEVVKVSTAHYVFPALYCNLKRKSLLSYIPEDLVAYMKHITDLNRERNEEIIAQAKEINTLLETHNIQPIFLKGTGFLLQGFYKDIAERMVGDIDFIVSDKAYTTTVQLLKKSGYNNKPHKLDNVKLGKHYPRLIHEEKIAAVEVHFRIIKDPYDRCLNYDTVKNSLSKTKDNISVLSYKNQVLHTIFNKQTNDLGYWYKTISLRNCYDLFLLSKKTNTLSAIQSAQHYFNILNTFLASCNYVFNTIPSICFTNNKTSAAFVKHQIELLDSSEKMKAHKKKWSLFFNTKTRLKKLKLAFVNKDVRGHLLDLLLKR